jgi:hypothetical protein
VGSTPPHTLSSCWQLWMAQPCWCELTILHPPVPLGPMVTQILGVPEPQLVLLINRNISAAAIDAGGVRWQTQRLCWDDLTIECVMGEEVHCSGEFMPRGSSVLDLQSGDQLSGPRYAK